MRQGLPQQYVLAIQPHDGKVLWKTEIGTFRQGQQYYYYYMPETLAPASTGLPRRGDLCRHARRRARAARRGNRRVRLGIWLQDGTRSSPDIASYYYERRSPRRSVGRRSQTGEAFLVKGMQSERLYAVEPNKMKVLWERPITKASRLLGVDDNAVYLGGDELSAVDSEDAEALVGDTRSGRQHGRARAGAARRPLATDARAASTRSTPVRATCGGSSAARTWASSAATCCSPIAGCWRSPIGRSPPIPAGRRQPKSPPATTPHPQKEQTRHE